MGNWKRFIFVATYENVSPWKPRFNIVGNLLIKPIFILVMVSFNL